MSSEELIGWGRGGCTGFGVKTDPDIYILAACVSVCPWVQEGGSGARPLSHSDFCATKRTCAVLQLGNEKRATSLQFWRGFFCYFKRRAKNTPS